jgi:hypothetical protein
MKKIELTKEKIDEILHLYNEKLLGSHSISKLVGLNKQIILRTLKENGVILGSSGRKFIGGKKIAEKKYRDKNKERLDEYYKEWSKNKKEHRKEYLKQYREKNKEKIKEVKRTYQKEKRHTDPIYKLISNFRTAIYTVLKENKLDKYTNYFNMVGYTAEQLKSHLEVQFKEGMTWENYGEWHVDHIKPISSFTFETCEDEEFKICWSLDNLQPMWGIENIKKGNKNYL